jgi:hypothetical protein
MPVVLFLENVEWNHPGTLTSWLFWLGLGRSGANY